MTRLKVTLKHSTIGRNQRQVQTVKGLGLRKIG
jgi:ribosomal protein L30/L7E